LEKRVDTHRVVRGLSEMTTCGLELLRESLDLPHEENRVGNPRGGNPEEAAEEISGGEMRAGFFHAA
jgi:hypothetical protein